MVGVGYETGLAAGERVGGDAHVVQSHPHERNSFSFTCGEQHVHLAPGLSGRDSVGQAQEFVCFFAHGTDNQDDIVAAGTSSLDLFGHLAHPRRIGNRRASELLDDESHVATLPLERRAPSCVIWLLRPYANTGVRRARPQQYSACRNPALSRSRRHSKTLYPCAHRVLVTSLGGAGLRPTRMVGSQKYSVLASSMYGMRFPRRPARSSANPNWPTDRMLPYTPDAWPCPGHCSTGPTPTGTSWCCCGDNSERTRPDA